MAEEVIQAEVTENTPTVEELTAELASVKAERERQKLALDKALKEKGQLVKSLREKQTTEEAEEEERKAKEEKLNADYESALAELNHLKATNAYTNAFSEEKTIESMIEAVKTGNHAEIATIITKEKEKAVKQAEAEWLKSRNRVNFGDETSTMTREQIMAITDATQRQKAIEENYELFV